MIEVNIILQIPVFCMLLMLLLTGLSLKPRNPEESETLILEVSLGPRLLLVKETYILFQWKQKGLSLILDLFCKTNEVITQFQHI